MPPSSSSLVVDDAPPRKQARTRGKFQLLGGKPGGAVTSAPPVRRAGASPWCPGPPDVRAPRLAGGELDQVRLLLSPAHYLSGVRQFARPAAHYRHGAVTASRAAGRRSPLPGSSGCQRAARDRRAAYGSGGPASGADASARYSCAASASSAAMSSASSLTSILRRSEILACVSALRGVSSVQQSWSGSSEMARVPIRRASVMISVLSQPISGRRIGSATASSSAVML